MLTNEDMLSRLQEAVPGALIEAPQGLIDFTLIIDAGVLLDAARFLREELGFDYLTNLTSVEWPDRFEVVYNLYGVRAGRGLLTVKVPLTDKENPRLPSVIGVWKAADLQEREVYDLMGIHFEGHPNLKRIMMWEGFQGHPLRKDFENRTFTYAELEPTRQATEDW